MLDTDPGTQDRSIVLTQLLFGAAALAVFTTVMLFGPGEGNSVAFFLGLLLTFVACCAAVLTSWSKLSPHWLLVLPLLDILAIGCMRHAHPELSLGLLWVFPVLWIATLVGAVGITASILLIGVLTVGEIALRQQPVTLAAMPTLIFLPITLVFVAASVRLHSRRNRAQRVLLRKQAELLEGALAQAQRQEELLSEVLNTVDFGVVRIDKTGQINLVNEAQTRMQLDERHASTSSLRAGKAGGFRAGRAAASGPASTPLQRAMRGEEFEPETVWLEAASGEKAALSVTARHLHSKHGEYDGSVVVSRDVTAEVMALRARDDLVASVSHELRTPLTSVLGYLELTIDGGGLPASAEAQLQVAHKNANRLLDLLTDILAASNSAEQPLVLLPGPCELLDVVEQSVEMLQPWAEERGIRIDCAAAEATTLIADGSRLRQLIDNVISNAIKYNVDQGEVSIGLTSDENMVWLIVRDSGIGIADDEQPRLFERFFRSESVRNSTVHGSGLGLGISREIARLHGGDLTVQSVEGEGTTVLLTLPKDRDRA
ncbi:hypothetical protein AWU67_11690 [Microterricola viridarii]|uniref:histidine kinase n=1 Tax=Microterricola viridarii TaxID=412690 RepID=A0A0X8E4J3_9MICO|nr:hypothetical protein AWU67_11690 [Microterricola viridarii]